MAASISVIALFSGASIFGIIAFSACGFGDAICFLFVYQIAVFSGMMDCCNLPDLKYAVFLTTIARTITIPPVVWHCELRRHLRWEFLVTMLPMQIVGPLIGQYIQQYAPTNVLTLVLGLITAPFAVWQIIKVWISLKSKPSLEKPSISIKNNCVVPDLEETGHNEVEVIPLEVDKDEKASQPVPLGDSYIRGNWEMLKKEMWPLRPVIFWMTFCSLVGGVTAGLLGVGGPPMIAFYFFYEYPVQHVRVNTAVIYSFMSVIRMLGYLATPPPASYPYDAWFSLDNLYLILAVSVFSLASAPVGNYLSRYLDNAGFKISLAVLLVINSISMIATASIGLLD